MEYQVYKALEFQYRKGFKELEHSINEISCDLILKGNTILFKPTLEELKDKYYNEIKKYIAYPL